MWVGVVVFTQQLSSRIKNIWKCSLRISVFETSNTTFPSLAFRTIHNLAHFAYLSISHWDPTLFLNPVFFLFVCHTYSAIHLFSSFKSHIALLLHPYGKVMAVHLFLFLIEFIAVTLVHKTIVFKCTTQQNIISHCIVCSSPKAKSLFPLPISTPHSLWLLPHCGLCLCVI